MTSEPSITPLSTRRRAPSGKSAAVGLVKACYGWFVQHSCHGEGMDWIRDGIDAVDGAGGFGSQHALTHVIASYARLWSAPEEPARRLEMSLAFYRETGDRWGESLALTAYAWLSSHERPEQAEEYMLESLRLSQEVEDPFQAGQAGLQCGRAVGQRR